MKRLTALLFAVMVFAAPSAYPFGQNKVVYDQFKWNIYHSTHFDIYYYNEERAALQRVVDSAESAYLDLSSKFNYQITKKIPLIYYATHSEFEQTNVMLNFIPEGVGAFAEPARNRMVLPIDLSDDQLLELITHELTHIFEYEVLFQGKLGKTITANPPTWFMEGLASFMAQDEDSRDRMVLRDAVVNDRIPPITRNPQGYFAYRFGHAVFAYIQQKHGWEGLRDFIYEYRNTLGSSVNRAIKRAFDEEPDEFDTRFRTWLRKQYLPALVAKGEPQEYGEPIRINADIDNSYELSPVPSPSGDLLAAFTTYKEDVDVALFNIPERKLLKNLTAGYTSKYEYPIAQSFTTGPSMGRDLAFSPSGDQVAVFVRRERGRDLLLINPISGEIDRTIPMLGVDQQLSPAYSPDGTRIAFSAFRGTQADIFVYDLQSNVIENVTNDRFFDGAPVFSPDGKWLYYSSTANLYAKIFRVNLANRAERFQITTGDWNDIDAWFSPDGKRLFYASDKQTGRDAEHAADILEKAENSARREGNTPPPDKTNFASFNIYSLNLENGDVLQYTDVIGGCFTPVVFMGHNNRERMVFSSYYKGQWRLFSTPTDTPLHAAEKTVLSSAPIENETRAAFRPTSEFIIDEDKIEKAGGFKLFVDDVDVNAGVSSDQLFVSRSTIYMSDMLGNRRFIASLDSVSSFSNFDFLYFDMQRRLNWGVRVFDNRSFYTAPNYGDDQLISRKQAYRETGAVAILSYPFTRYHRVDMGGGYIQRDLNYPVQDPSTGQYAFLNYRDQYPLVSAAFSGDSTAYKFFGPVAGRRYQLSASYAPDIDRGGTLSSDFIGEWREYKQITSRSLIAARVFTAWSEGNLPNLHYFGGLNTVRGYDFRSIVGNRAAYANLELRFPLVDLFLTPLLAIQQVRGVMFVDVGTAQLQGQEYRFIRNGRLESGAASVGWGFSFNFMGLPLHWDFAKRYDGKELEKGFRTSFWIGQTF